MELIHSTGELPDREAFRTLGTSTLVCGAACTTASMNLRTAGLQMSALQGNHHTAVLCSRALLLQATQGGAAKESCDYQEGLLVKRQTPHVCNSGQEECAHLLPAMDFSRKTLSGNLKP